jgi:hypothetical protein
MQQHTPLEVGNDSARRPEIDQDAPSSGDALDRRRVPLLHLAVSIVIAQQTSESSSNRFGSRFPLYLHRRNPLLQQ